MTMEIIIGIGIVVFIVLFIILATASSKKKIRNMIAKIEVSLESIGECLTKNISILDNSREFIKDEEFCNGYSSVNFGKMTSIETYQIINKYNAILRDIMIDDEELIKNKEFNELVDELREVKSYMEGSVRYYNDCVQKYDELFKKFPTNIVKMFCGYKKFENYSEEKMSTL